MFYCYLYAHHTLYIALHSWVITMALNHLAPPILGSKPVPKLKNHWVDLSETVQLSVLWFYHSKIWVVRSFPLSFLSTFIRIWDLRSAVLGFIIGAFSTSAFYQGLVSNLVFCRFTMPRICCTIEHMRTGKTHESHIQNCNSGHFERPGAQASSFLCNCWLSLTCFACSSHWGWFPVKMLRGLGDGLWHWLYRFTTFVVVVSKPWALILWGSPLRDSPWL